VIRTPETLVDKRYLHTVFLSDDAKAVFSEAASGAVVQNLNAGKARLLPVPLPPLSEQHRIVAKVDELMALCDRLETGLATANYTRHLLTALLAEALEPAGADELLPGRAAA
jgi:type I restriction enzyme, S subunit